MKRHWRRELVVGDQGRLSRYYPVLLLESGTFAAYIWLFLYCRLFSRTVLISAARKLKSKALVNEEVLI